jgi:AMP-binding enzyme C-terminal domain
VLDRHPGIQSSAVATLSDTTGQNRLWGFFVPSIASAPESADLKQFLAARLPEHMIPVGLTCIDTLPLTPNGKLDRVALTRLLPRHAAPPEKRAVNPTEARLLTICREMVAHPPDESLLDSGFHSLAFAQLAWRIKKNLVCRRHFRSCSNGTRSRDWPPWSKLERPREMLCRSPW